MTEEEKKAAALRIAEELKNGRGSAERMTRKRAVMAAAQNLLAQRDAGKLKGAQLEAMREAEQQAQAERRAMKRAEDEARKQLGTAMIERERARTAPNKYENRFFMDLMILRNTLLANMEHSRERLKKTGKWAWRDARILLALVQKTMDRLMDTMPESRLGYYETIRQHGRYVMTLEGPVRQPREVVITDVRLGAITDAAVRGECGLCLKEGHEVEKCPLRDALLEVAPPGEIKSGYQFGCEYRDVSRQLDAGEDLEI
jgi:hypothetical protein